MKNSNLHIGPRGFTLIELMITIAIVAILVAMAVPAYKDYSVRSKVAECINNATVPKVSISEYWQTLGAWPPNLEEAGIVNSGISQYCDGYTSYNAASTSIFQIDVNEANVATPGGTIQPQMEGRGNPRGGVDWYCSRGATAPADLKYLPSTCRST